MKALQVLGGIFLGLAASFIYMVLLAAIRPSWAYCLFYILTFLAILTCLMFLSKKKESVGEFIVGIMVGFLIIFLFVGGTLFLFHLGTLL